MHFHMLFPDEAYLAIGSGRPVFRDVLGPGQSELYGLVEQTASGIGCVLERRGLVERKMENVWLTSGEADGPLDDLIGHSIAYRITVGSRAGQKLFTAQARPTAMPEAEQLGDGGGAAQAAGFSLHAGIDIAPHQGAKLELLCRYLSRPPVCLRRLAPTASGKVRSTLKTPYRDGTTHIVLEPLHLRHSLLHWSGHRACT